MKTTKSKIWVSKSKLLEKQATTSVTKIHPLSTHVPLLFLSGCARCFIPASLNYANYKKYTHSQSLTGYKEFAVRNHFVLGQPDWKENAGYILNWLAKI